MRQNLFRSCFYEWLPVHHLPMTAKTLLDEKLADLCYFYYKQLALLRPLPLLINSVGAQSNFSVKPFVVIFSLLFLSIHKYHPNLGSHTDSGTIFQCTSDHPHTQGHRAASMTVDTHS